MGPGARGKQSYLGSDKGARAWASTAHTSFHFTFTSSHVQHVRILLLRGLATCQGHRGCGRGWTIRAATRGGGVGVGTPLLPAPSGFSHPCLHQASSPAAGPLA